MKLSVKHISKQGVQKFLETLVKIKLARVKPKIIGITGSFGKTSTKEAVYEVLKTRWRVYRNPKSLNTEIGLLLAILEQSSGFSSPIKWALVLGRAINNALRGKYYDFLVLEYGADKPGDIKHLVSVVKPDVSIITSVARVHQDSDQFENKEAVFEEKKKLVMCLEKNDIAILNRADPLLATLKNKITAPIFWFNSEEGISTTNMKNTKTGFEATIHMDNQKIPAEFSIPGAYHINIILPALLCGTLFGISIKEGSQALKNFHLPPGRMSIIPAKHGAVILDSSYNASPETVKMALELLKEFPGKRKIAILGNMNELGEYSPEGHREVGQCIGDWLGELITVGDQAATIADEALKKGFPKSRIKVLLDALQTAEFLNSRMAKGDVLLFKGSQNRVRLERAVKLLMAHPEDADKLLCRQEKEWQEIR